MQGKTEARRILVVDDNRDAAFSLAVLLRTMGHLTEVALNGDSAIEVARRFRPEIILLDLVLPDCDGCDLARELKGEPGLETVRIFAVTGYGGEEDRRRSMQAGCEAHLLKPVEARVLESLLEPR